MEQLFVSILQLFRGYDVQMCTLKQSTNFSERVGLRNSYYNCFHLMRRVERVPGTFLCNKQKRAHACMIHRLKVLCTVNSLDLQVFNTVDLIFPPVDIHNEKMRPCSLDELAIRPLMLSTYLTYNQYWDLFFS